MLLRMNEDFKVIKSQNNIMLKDMRFNARDTGLTTTTEEGALDTRSCGFAEATSETAHLSDTTHKN